MKASSLLLALLVALAAVAALAGPVIVTTYSDVGVLPTAPRHYRAATIVSEAELQRYGPVPTTTPTTPAPAAPQQPAPFPFASPFASQLPSAVQPPAAPAVPATQQQPAQFVPDPTLAARELQLQQIIQAQHAKAESAGAQVQFPQVAAAAPVVAAAPAPVAAPAAAATSGSEACYKCVSSWYSCKSTCASRCPGPESWCTSNCVSETCGPQARDCYVSARCTQAQIDQANKDYPCRSCSDNFRSCTSASRMLRQCGDPAGRGAWECYGEEYDLCVSKAAKCHAGAKCAGVAPKVPTFAEVKKAIQDATAKPATSAVKVGAAAPVAAATAAKPAAVAAPAAQTAAAPASSPCFDCVSSWYDCKATCASRCPGPESWCTSNCVSESCGPQARDCYVSARCTQAQIDQANKDYPCRACSITLSRCSTAARMIHQCGDPWGNGAGECYRDELNICMQKASKCHAAAKCTGAAPTVNVAQVLQAINAAAGKQPMRAPLMRLAALANPTAAAAPGAPAPPKAAAAAAPAAAAAAAPAAVAPVAVGLDVVPHNDADITPASGAASAPLDHDALESERQWAQLRDVQDQLTKTDDAQTDVQPTLDVAASLPLVASNGASKRDQFLALIRSKLGAKYVFGSAGPNTFDCSGLVYWAAKQVGLNLPRTAHEQYTKAGTKVATVAARQPGDLIFFGKAGQRVYHVGVYVGPNQMINAPNSKSVVRQENYSYWPDKLTTARRLF